MGTTKTNLFSAAQNELAMLTKALGHPARIAIIQQILKSDKCMNSLLVNELGLAQATISQHLKALKEAEIIRGTIEGTAICYCINESKWLKAKKILEDLFMQHPCCSSTKC